MCLDAVGTAQLDSDSARGSLSLCVCFLYHSTQSRAYVVCSNHAGSSRASTRVCVLLYPCVHLHGSVVVIMPVKRQKLLAWSSPGEEKTSSLAPHAYGLPW